MRVQNSSTTISLFLNITLMITSSAESISSFRQEQLLPAAVNQLLRERPLPAEAPGQEAANPARVKNGPPADDAPIEELIRHWSNQRNGGTPSGPQGLSDIVRERLLSAAERRPWILPRLYDFLPQNKDAHNRLYQILSKDPNEFDDIQENNWRVSLYWWLQFHTQFLRNELIDAVRTRDNNDSGKPDEIEALARLDWPTAKPLVANIVASGESVSSPMALSQLYLGATQDSDTAQADIYRVILKRLLLENNISENSRRTILRTLMKDEWPGQDEWFISLFGNPKLSLVSEALLAAQRLFTVYRDEIAPYPNTTESIMDHYGRIAGSEMTPLSTALSLNPDKWIPLVAGLTDHKEVAVRNAAISSLAEFLNNDEADKKYRESAARALLPWLADPDWASAPGRYDLFIGLSKIDLPESAPYLLQALDNCKEAYSRKAVVEALARHCDPRTAPALRNFLPKESDKHIRWKIVIALARCGGFSDAEMAAAIESYADMAATAEGQQTIKETLSRESEKTFPLNVMVGKTLFESDMSWATEGFAAILFDGLKELNPVAAKLILDKVRALPLNIARVKLIERIGKESANLADLKLALRDRASLAENLRGELSDLVKRGGYAGGIAAIVLGDHNSQMEILKGKDLQAQIALLAGARYLIEKLPIDLLGDLIARPDKNLAQAVENYLEVEGGAAARKLILARHSNEKPIMGDISSLADYQKELGDLKIWEEKLRAETLAPGGAEEIYALAPAVPSKRLKSLVIRVRQEKAEISIYDTEGNRKLREMDESEFRELKEFTSRPEVEDLGPESWRIKKPIVPYEYLRLTKDGGKRVILTGYRSAPKSPSLHEKLADIFYRIGNSGEYKQ